MFLQNFGKQPGRTLKRWW